MTTAEIIQVVLTGALVIITCVYAWRTFVISRAAEKQADASKKMAKEMEASKFEAVRPIVAINHSGASKEDVSAIFKNIGLGPALNLKCYLTHPNHSFKFKLDGYQVLAVGEDHSISFPLQGLNLKGSWPGFAINCDYEDIYKRPFRSVLKFSSENERELEIIEL